MRVRGSCGDLGVTLGRIRGAGGIEWWIGVNYAKVQNLKVFVRRIKGAKNQESQYRMTDPFLLLMHLTKFQVEFSYGQFLVYDTEVKFPGNAWTDRHFDQGFARRKSSVNFRTLFQFGWANIDVFRNEFIHNENYEWIISVPFEVISGELMWKGRRVARSALFHFIQANTDSPHPSPQMNPVRCRSPFFSQCSKVKTIRAKLSKPMNVCPHISLY